jgi:hypothetical protein
MNDELDVQTARATRTSGQVSRRTLSRGVAWTTPVIAVSAHAPAYASSLVPCPVLPAGNEWATTVDGRLGPTSSGGFGWSDANRFEVYRDNGSSRDPVTVYSATAVTVIPGATYAVSFGFYWGFGNGSPLLSTGGTFSVLFNGVAQKTVTTRTPDVDANGSTLGTQPGSTTQTFTYTVPAGTTSLTVAYRYVMTPRILVANDDIAVDQLSFNSCTAN